MEYFGHNFSVSGSDEDNDIDDGGGDGTLYEGEDGDEDDLEEGLDEKE